MKEEIENINLRITGLENDLEQIFAITMAKTMKKKDIVEVLEDVITDYFKIPKRDFKFNDFKLESRFSRKLANENKELTEARKWMIIMSRFVLLKTCGYLKLEYNWYSVKNEWNYRKEFSSILSPINPKEKALRKTFLDICRKVKEESKGYMRESEFDHINYDLL